MRHLILLVLLLPMLAFAGGDDDCKRNPHHCEGERGPPGEDGQDGQDGRDGVDGQDGADGIDGQDGAAGRDGVDGRDGIDGIDGVVPTEWITNTNNTFNIHNKWIQSYRDAAAAEAAMQVHLPQNQTSRLTIGMSRINNTSGYALGYAYMLHNESNTALTFAVGFAGDETVVKGSFGFEFGGSRKIDMSGIVVEARVLPLITEPIPEEYVTETELEIADEQLMRNVEIVVAEVDERVDGIEARLDANAAVARADRQEREEWKAELTVNYLTEN